MSLITQKPNYSIADGDKVFDPVQIQANVPAMIQAYYDSLDADDTQLQVLQSADGGDYSEMPGSLCTIDKSKDSHSYTITGLAPGSFISLKLIHGSAAAGTISKISYLI